MTTSAFTPSIASSSNVARTAARGSLHLASKNGERLLSPIQLEAKKALDEGNLDRHLAMYLASTGRAPDAFYLDDDFFASQR